MPDIKVMFDVMQHFIHVTGDGDVSVRYECADQKTIANQILHTLLKSHKFHCWAAASLISLRLTWKKKLNQIITSNSCNPETKPRSYLKVIINQCYQKVVRTVVEHPEISGV